MKNTIITSILAIGFTTALAIAAGTPVTYIFQGGDPASATQVNANFQELADRIDTVSTSDVYDYHSYVTDSSIQSKEYDTTGRCGDKEIRTYSRTPVTGGTKVTLTRKDTNAGVTCSHIEFDQLYTATEFQLLGIRRYDPSIGTILHNSTNDDPLAIMTSAMKMNNRRVETSSVTVTVPATDDYGDIRELTLIGIEDVTVPYNGGTTYTGCLKFHKTTPSIVQQIDWYCPGLGYTKSMLFNTNGTFIARELSNIQY